MACINLHQTGFVGKGSDYFGRPAPPREGVCGGAKFFASALLLPARSVCVSPSVFFHFYAALLCFLLLGCSCGDPLSDGLN